MVDLEALLLRDYRLHGRRSSARARAAFAHLRSELREIRPDRCYEASQRYGLRRRASGAAAATVRYEIAVLGRALTLALCIGLITMRPVLARPTVRNARQGFVSERDITKLLCLLPEPIRDLTLFAYVSGWRKREILGLTWERVDFDAGVVRLEASKNGEGRTYPIGRPSGALADVPAPAARAARSVGVPPIRSACALVRPHMENCLLPRWTRAYAVPRSSTKRGAQHGARWCSAQRRNAAHWSQDGVGAAMPSRTKKTLRGASGSSREWVRSAAAQVRSSLRPATVGSRTANRAAKKIVEVGVAAVFLTNVQRRGKSDHWFWISAKHARGRAGFRRPSYGQFRYAGMTIPAHRASWILFRGSIPNGLVVCHKCLHDHCVNPDHLFLGTVTENSWHALFQGRMGGKFTAREYERMVDEFAASPNTDEDAWELAREKYGIPVRRIIQVWERYCHLLEKFGAEIFPYRERRHA